MSLIKKETNKVVIDLASFLKRSQDILELNKKYFENLILLYVTNNYTLQICAAIVDFIEKEKFSNEIYEFLNSINFFKELHEQTNYLIDENKNIRKIIKKIESSLISLVSQNIHNSSLKEELEKIYKSTNQFYDKLCKTEAFLDCVTNSVEKLKNVDCHENLVKNLSEVKNIVIMIYQLKGTIIERKLIY